MGLGQALRDGLPVPPGVALAGAVVDAVAGRDEDAIRRVAESVAALHGPLAVRSSAVDEDGAEASFAGQHLTLLNVRGADELTAAISEVWWSANSDSAITYRQRVGLFTRPSVGVVIQALVEPETAGVMFTQNPVTGADERVIEASLGLGEAVVAGRVIPDHYRVGRAGEILERTRGTQGHCRSLAPRRRHTSRSGSRPSWSKRSASTTSQLAELNGLAARCEQVYGPARDIEWAISAGKLYLLQCRAVTTVAA